MGKFCSNCGKPLREGAAFCSGCGAKQITAPDATTAPQPTVSPLAAPTAAPSVYNQASKNNSIVGIIAVTVAAVIVIVLIIFGCVRIFGRDNSSSKKSSNIFLSSDSSLSDSSSADSSSSSGSFETPFRKPIDNLAKGMENCDWDTFIGAFPDELAKKLNETLEAAGMDKIEFLKTYAIKKLEDEYGDNLKISFIITDKTKMKSSELSSLEEKLNSKLGCNVTIKEGYEVKLKEKITGSKKIDSPYEIINVVKIGDKWSVLNDDVLDAF